MAQLLQPLVVGETYYISFYVSAAWNGTESNPQHYVATSNTGALFSMQPRPWAIGDSWPVPNNIAHVYHPWVIADTMNWILVSGSFVADSAYQYVMLGNHFNNALTDTLHFANGTSLPKAYTIIDNVCVSTDPSGCPLAMGEPVIEQPILANLYPNPAQDVLTLRTIGMDEEVWVIDALGRVIWQSLSGNELLSIDVSGWSRGAYILRVQQSGGIRLFNFMLIE
jgi:hypothetical protein